MNSNQRHRHSIGFLQLPVILLMLIAITISHGQNQQQTDLVGTWEFSESPSFASISEEDKELYDENPQLMDQALAGYKDRKLVFNADGGFNQLNSNGNHVNGTWILEGQTLTIQSSSGYSWVQEVILLNSEDLTLRQMAIGDAKPVLSELHFTKTL